MARPKLKEQKRTKADRRRTDLIVYTGFLSAQLPELSKVETERLIETVDLYLQTWDDIRIAMM